MRIFISAPYTNPDPCINVREVIFAAEVLIKKGHIPFLPHLNHLWHLICSHPIEFWYDFDLKWLDVCDAILRLPGESYGADKEIEYAINKGKKVFYGIDEL